MKVNTFLNMTNYFHNCHKTQNTLTNLGSIMKDTKQAIMVKSAILKYATAAFWIEFEAEIFKKINKEKIEMNCAIFKKFKIWF